MSSHTPVGVPRSLNKLWRYQIAWNPKLHNRVVVDGISATDDFGRRIGRILMRTDFPQVDAAPRLEISMQDVARRGYYLSASMWKRLKHDRAPCYDAKRASILRVAAILMMALVAAARTSASGR
jgi:hypothetical protein